MNRLAKEKSERRWGGKKEGTV